MYNFPQLTNMINRKLLLFSAVPSRKITQFISATSICNVFSKLPCYVSRLKAQAMFLSLHQRQKNGGTENPFTILFSNSAVLVNGGSNNILSLILLGQRGASEQMNPFVKYVYRYLTTPQAYKEFKKIVWSLQDSL